MRWLCRCGTAFVTTSAEVPSTAEPELLHVVLQQTEARLLGAPRSDGLSDVHEHPVLQALSDSLAEAEVDWVGRRFDFHQSLPKGLFAIVLSRCANLCDSRSSFWRRELRAVMGSAPCVPRMPWSFLALRMLNLQVLVLHVARGAPNRTLAAFKIADLHRRAGCADACFGHRDYLAGFRGTQAHGAVAQAGGREPGGA